MTTFTEQAIQEIEQAEQSRDLYIRAAAQDARAALLDSPLVLPWLDTCPELAAPDAGTFQRLAYDASCAAWEARLRASLALLAEALQGAGESGAAETLRALSDQAATMGEQAGAVAPTRENFEWPWWLKWGLGVIAARELLGLWGAIRK